VAKITVRTSMHSCRLRLVCNVIIIPATETRKLINLRRLRGVLLTTKGQKDAICFHKTVVFQGKLTLTCTLTESENSQQLSN
jgi:hypothetical protein